MECNFLLLGYDAENELCSMIEEGPFNTLSALFKNKKALKRVFDEQQIQVLCPLEFDPENEGMLEGMEEDEHWSGWDVAYFKQKEQQQSSEQLLALFKQLAAQLSKLLSKEELSYNREAYHEFIDLFEQEFAKKSFQRCVFVEIWI